MKRGREIRSTLHHIKVIVIGQGCVNSPMRFHLAMGGDSHILYSPYIGSSLDPIHTSRISYRVQMLPVAVDPDNVIKSPRIGKLNRRYTLHLIPSDSRRFDTDYNCEMFTVHCQNNIRLCKHLPPLAS